ncbi:hypothetical protein K402DRAFT_389457 [Aulographum hederae CBS 113979]|uniref:Tcp11-domain-containing protein n=1 Tax=Aulographum hederae CBS 113979 TaxID=1176131 RepID=A0A6G1HDP7_9PEZI|nr:hypothetical protein K402DRAFT_389457 [Aulographum hederae CBS 113979]
MQNNDPTATEVDLEAYPPNDDIPEESEVMNVSNDTEQLWATPPARIAARFYKQSSGRRKSSAASSRRNSISSTHSHQSNRSFRGAGCQSNHIAQHLRRTSIIESRKARLADRAAHAEQVRLRAALAKATPRSSNSEERALAAQQAREKHLERVAAACAEEVRRAKKVAEDQKERKAAEEKKTRMEMEERLADAEKRRLEYKARNQRRPRTASVPASDVKKPSTPAPPVLDQETAARRIQASWRLRKRKQILQAFYTLDLTIERVSQADFKEVSVLLSDKSVLETTTSLLQMLGLQTSDDKPLHTGTRNFLSSYLILGRPAEILSSKDGEMERHLINKAKDLMIGFDSTMAKALASPQSSADPTELETLAMAHTAFLKAFADWKAQDSSTLVEGMVAAFVNLDAIYQSVKDDTDGEAARDYSEGIRENQIMLLSKIRKLAGPERASNLIKKAIRESRKQQKTRRKPVGDLRPRLVEQESMAEASAAASTGDIQTTTEVTSQIQPEKSIEGNDQTQALRKLFSPIPTNRELVHELSIDKEYRIDTIPQPALRDHINRQIVESMRAGFKRGDGNNWTIAMAHNIRSKLLGLLKPGNSMHKAISEALDPEHINAQCSQGVFSYEKFFNWIASILPQLCAPYRDEEVKALAGKLKHFGDLDDMVDKLFELLHVIDLLSLDYSNFLLMSAAPRLIQEAPGYEQRMFAQDLQNGAITLQQTKRWWRNASVNMLTELHQYNPIQGPTAQKIYAWALVDLAISPAPLQEKEVPETLSLDSARISRMRSEAVRIATVGAMLLTAKNMLKRDTRSQWKAEANRMWELLKDGYKTDDDDSSSSMPAKMLSVVESSHAMPATTKTALSGTYTRLLAQASTGRLTDPTLKVLFQRLRGQIMNRVSASSSKERVNAASTITDALANNGIPEFVNQVGAIVDQLARISEVDRKAHGVWYEEVAREVEDMGDEDATSSSSASGASSSV